MHGMEFMAEEDCPRILVRAEEAFNGELESAGCRVVALQGEVEDEVIDGAKKLVADATLGLIPL